MDVFIVIVASHKPYPGEEPYRVVGVTDNVVDAHKLIQIDLGQNSHRYTVGEMTVTGVGEKYTIHPQQVQE